MKLPGFFTDNIHIICRLFLIISWHISYFGYIKGLYALIYNRRYL